MSKKDNKKTQDTSSTKQNYTLKTDAVNRLVNADKKTYPKTKTDPGKDFRSKGFLDKIPAPIKALFIKFWFNGAVCFFIFWGLGNYIYNSFDMIVVIGIVLGMVNDILVKNTFHFLAITPGSNDKWMLFPQKKYWTFFANILYYCVVLGIVVWIYEIINIALIALNGTPDTIYLGVEPILFGVFCVMVDMIFVGLKNLTSKIVLDAKEKNKG